MHRNSFVTKQRECGSKAGLVKGETNGQRGLRHLIKVFSLSLQVRVLLFVQGPSEQPVISGPLLCAPFLGPLNSSTALGLRPMGEVLGGSSVRGKKCRSPTAPQKLRGSDLEPGRTPDPEEGKTACGGGAFVSWGVDLVGL